MRLFARHEEFSCDSRTKVSCCHITGWHLIRVACFTSPDCFRGTFRECVFAADRRNRNPPTISLLTLYNEIHLVFQRSTLPVLTPTRALHASPLHETPKMTLINYDEGTRSRLCIPYPPSSDPDVMRVSNLDTIKRTIQHQLTPRV